MYLQKSRPILDQKLADNTDDVALAAAVVLSESAVYSLNKCLFDLEKQEHNESWFFVLSEDFMGVCKSSQALGKLSNITYEICRMGLADR